jgi:hypothetical protein
LVIVSGIFKSFFNLGVVCLGQSEKRNAYWILVGKPGGKDHDEDLDVSGRIIKMDLRERGWGGMDWIHLAEVKDQ